jgi:hypothetical protein
MALALLVVPPFLKYASGPLLGPAMLAGAAVAAGHRADIADLNARWIERALDGVVCRETPFVGDHGRDDGALRGAHQSFVRGLSQHFDAGVYPEGDPAGVLGLRCEHRAALDAAARVASSVDGAWVRALLDQHAEPDLVGISVLWSGQVAWGLAISQIVRVIWPRAKVIWGGAHVTALAPEISADARYGALVDAFVVGYAEHTFVATLDAIDGGGAWPAGCFRAGEGVAPRAVEDGAVVPRFPDTTVPRGARLTLPAQLSRGCAYGRCAFCTYPATEGVFREVRADAAAAVIKEAAGQAACVAFKDSLLTAPLLRLAAKLARGEVAWGGCTKLAPALDLEMMRDLAASGCRTLEIGLETLAADAQTLIHKEQSLPLFLRTLDAAAASGIALVVNYITGFPGIDRSEEDEWLERVRAEVGRRSHALVAKIEHNEFQLERGAPLARALPRGLRITGAWPWSSVLAWERVAAPLARQRLSVVA